MPSTPSRSTPAHGWKQRRGGGPGGADIAAALDGGRRIFFHGWLRGSGPCPVNFDAQTDDGGRRGMCLGVLGWDSNDNPVVNKLLSPD
ncbi:hypothetical protein [Corallococcus sp. EGB]|uniref:hypothetical protein n=1 Tax=Corallococcus sp. EGB TaxID=1521117 RepID=UPI001CBD2A60|nr:hypothetical protein [Corallococcus sp. EGB]